MSIHFRGFSFVIVFMIVCCGTLAAANFENTNYVTSNQIRLIENDNDIECGMFSIKDVSKIRQTHEVYGSILNSLMDVCFSDNYKVYPLLDRRLVTSPSMIELLHRGWGSFGFRSC